MNRRKQRHLVAVFLGKAQDDVPPLWGGVGGVKHLEARGRRKRARRRRRKMSMSFKKKAIFQLDSEEDEEEEA